MTTSIKLVSAPRLAGCVQCRQSIEAGVQCFRMDYRKPWAPRALFTDYYHIDCAPQEIWRSANDMKAAKATIGLAGTDILITETEADYLKRLKDLLGGSKMVITKGDLRIEVE